MSKEKEKKEKIFKSSFFLKLFLIPSICWALLEIWVKDMPNDDGSITTWSELLQETFIVVAVWLIISFIIALVVNEVKKSKPKTKIVKEVQYITKPDDKITVKTEEMREEIKKELKEEMKKEIKKKKNEKCLFSCESVVDGYEYKKMAKYFPKRMYWVFVIRGTIFNVIISALIALTTQSWIATLIFLVAYEIYLLIYYKVRLEHMAEKVHNARLKRGEIEVNFETEFYEDYFIRKGEKTSVTIDYSEITRCVENDTNFYLEYANRNMVIIIQKNRCDLELINFIRNKFKNLENNLGDTSSYKGNKKVKNPNLTKTLMILLFVATLCCLWGALWSVSLINEINPQHGFNFTKNTWVFWCWLPIPIASIILGFIYNSKGLKCTKNIVAGFIIGFLLVYGAFSLFPTFSEDYNKINDYKQYIDASIPSNGELEIQNWETYFDDDKTEYAIINAYYDKEDVSKLENSIEESNNWILSTKLKSELKILLPTQFRSSDNVYYSIYNKTTNEYNTIPNESGEYEIYSMYYDKSLKQLSIHKYKYNFNK